MKWIIYIIIILSSVPQSLQGQFMGYRLTGGKASVQIPFEYHNHFIILEAKINGRFPIKMILDSGAENTIIIYKEITDLAGAKYARRMQLLGSDRRTRIDVLLTQSLGLEFEGFRASRQAILVMENEFLPFEQYIGVRIEGILGMDLFKRFVVKIDYQNKLLTLTERSAFKTPIKDYQKLSILPDAEKFYINSKIKINEVEKKSTLLIDTGASLRLMLMLSETDTLLLPSQKYIGNVGRGLGGFILGYLGSVSELEFGSDSFSSQLCNFQILPDSLIYLEKVKEQQELNGLLGNVILEQYHLIFDYTDGILYYKPNRNFKKKQRDNRSGMQVIAKGTDLNFFEVEYVIPNSPAAMAGIQKGDQIKRINWRAASSFTLESLMRKLGGKKGKCLKIKLRREGKSYKTTLQLEDYYE